MKQVKILTNIILSAYFGTASISAYEASCNDKLMTCLCSTASEKMEILPKFTRPLYDKVVGKRQEYVKMLEHISHNYRLKRSEENKLEEIIFEIKKTENRRGYFSIIAASLFVLAPINSVLIMDSIYTCCGQRKGS